MIRSFVFSQGKLVDQDVSLELLNQFLQDEVHVWVDVENPTDEEKKQVLEDLFKFHPLAIEDCLAVSERPKVDDYESYIFLVIHAVDYLHSAHEFQTTELNMFIGRNFLVTVHDDPLRSISTMMDRVRRNAPMVARAADRMTYNILDSLLENYTPALEELSSEIAALEDKVLADPSVDILEDVIQLKTEVQRLRQIVSPQREVLARIVRGEFRIVRPHLLPYFRDSLDHLARIHDLSDTYRDSLTNTLQVHLNLQQMQVNKVIKVLTVLATLSLPLVVVTSFYGMNFRPPEFEMHWAAAYAWVFGISAVMIGVLYWVLKRMGWS